MPVRRRHDRHLALAASLLLAAPVPARAAGDSGGTTHDLAARLGAAMQRCWFAGGDRHFGDYVYSPEPNASGGPRILVVPRTVPDGRPVLVIEIREVDGRPHINVYGPLATGPVAERVAADLRRWLDGVEGCA
jgi:hypothetical protein